MSRFVRNKNIPKFQCDKKVLTKEDILSLVHEHEKFMYKYNMLEDYYQGKHKILSRTYDDPTKANNKITLDYCNYVTKVRVGYFSSNPISVSSEDETLSDTMSKILDGNDFKSVFSELDLMSSIYGHAMLAMYLDEDGEIKTVCQSPKDWMVVYDNTLQEKPIFAIRNFSWYDDVEKETKYDIELWTTQEIIKYKGSVEELKEVERVPHYFDGLPVIEFAENKNRKGSFEGGILILDSIEAIQSDVQNTIDYFSDCYLVLQGMDNTEPEDILVMKQNKVLLTPEDSSASFLTKDINDSYVENALKRLEEQFFLVTCTPRLTDSSFGSNSSGVAINYKLYSMQKSIDVKELIFYKGFKRMFRMMISLLNKKGITFENNDININFTRSLPIDLSSLSDSVSKLNGVVSHRTLLSQLDFVENVDLEMRQIEKEKQADVDFEKNNMDIYNESRVTEDEQE